MADEFDQWVQNYSQMKKNASVADKLDIISMQLLEIEENTKKVPELAQEIEGQNNEIDQANQEAGAMPGMPMGASPAGAPPAGAPPGAEGGAPAPMGNDGLVPAGPVEASASPKKVIRSKHSIAKESTEKSGFQETPEAKSSAAFDDLLRVLGDAVKEAAQDGNSSLAVQLSNIQEAVEQLIKDSDLPEDEKKKLKKASFELTPKTDVGKLTQTLEQNEDNLATADDLARCQYRIKRFLESVSRIYKAARGETYVNNEFISNKLKYLSGTLLTPEEQNKYIDEDGNIAVTSAVTLCSELDKKLNSGELEKKCTVNGKLNPNLISDFDKALGSTTLNTMPSIGFTGMTDVLPMYAKNSTKATSWSKLGSLLEGQVPRALFGSDSYFPPQGKNTTRADLDVKREAANSDRENRIANIFGPNGNPAYAEQMCIDSCAWAFGLQMAYLVNKVNSMRKVDSANRLISQIFDISRRAKVVNRRIREVFEYGTLAQKMDVYYTCNGYRNEIYNKINQNYGGLLDSIGEKDLLAFMHDNKNKDLAANTIMSDYSADFASDIKAISLSPESPFDWADETPLTYCMLIPAEDRAKLDAATPETLDAIIREAVRADNKNKYRLFRNKSRSLLYNKAATAEPVSDGGEQVVSEPASSTDPGENAEEVAQRVSGNEGDASGQDEMPQDELSTGSPGQAGDLSHLEDDNVSDGADDVVSAKDLGAIDLSQTPNPQGDNENYKDLVQGAREGEYALKLIDNLRETQVVNGLLTELKKKYPGCTLKSILPRAYGGTCQLTFEFSTPTSTGTPTSFEINLPLDRAPKEIREALTRNKGTPEEIKPEDLVIAATDYAYYNDLLHGHENIEREVEAWKTGKSSPAVNPYARFETLQYSGEDDSLDRLSGWFKNQSKQADEALSMIYSDLHSIRNELILRNRDYNDPDIDRLVKCYGDCLRAVVNKLPMKAFAECMDARRKVTEEILRDPSKQIAQTVLTDTDNALRGGNSLSNRTLSLTPILDKNGKETGQNRYRESKDWLKAYLDASAPFQKFRPPVNPAREEYATEVDNWGHAIEDLFDELYMEELGEISNLPERAKERRLNEFQAKKAKAIEAYKDWIKQRYTYQLDPIGISDEQSSKEMLSKARLARKAYKEIARATGLNPVAISNIIHTRSLKDILSIANALRRSVLWPLEDEFEGVSEDDIKLVKEAMKNGLFQTMSDQDRARAMSILRTHLIKNAPTLDVDKTPEELASLGSYIWSKYIQADDTQDEPPEMVNAAVNGFISAAGLSAGQVLTNWMDTEDFTKNPALLTQARKASDQLKAERSALTGPTGKLYKYSLQHRPEITMTKDWIGKLCMDGCAEFGLDPTTDGKKAIDTFNRILKTKYDGQTSGNIPDDVFAKTFYSLLKPRLEQAYLAEMSSILNQAISEKSLNNASGKEAHAVNTYLGLYEKGGFQTISDFAKAIRKSPTPDVTVQLKEMLRNDPDLVKEVGSVNNWIRSIQTDNPTEVPDTSFGKLGWPLLYRVAITLNSEPDPVSNPTADGEQDPEAWYKGFMKMASGSLLNSLESNDRSTAADKQIGVDNLLDDEFNDPQKLVNQGKFRQRPYFGRVPAKRYPFHRKEDMSRYKIADPIDQWDQLYNNYLSYLGMTDEERAEAFEDMDLTDDDVEAIKKLGTYISASEACANAENPSEEEVQTLNQQRDIAFNELPEYLQALLARRAYNDKFGARSIPTGTASSLLSDDIDLQRYVTLRNTSNQQIAEDSLNDLAEYVSSNAGSIDRKQFNTKLKALQAASAKYNEDLKDMDKLGMNASHRPDYEIQSDVNLFSTTGDILPWKVNSVIVGDDGKLTSIRDAVGEDNNPELKFAREHYSSAQLDPTTNTLQELVPDKSETDFPSISGDNRVTYPNMQVNAIEPEETIPTSTTQRRKPKFARE